MMLLLSVHSAAFLASARLAATTRLAMTALPATGPANRAAVGVNMYLPEDEPQALLSRVQWVKTESGLSFKEIEAGSGAVPGPRETVTIAYKASFLSSGEIIEQTAASRPLTITLGADFLPMFQEAVEGMAVGGTRRVLMPPSSQYSRLEENHPVRAGAGEDRTGGGALQAAAGHRQQPQPVPPRAVLDLPPGHPQLPRRHASWRGRARERRRLPQGTRSHT